MATFELILGLLFAGCLLVLLAGQVRLPYPALLALAGGGLAFVPGLPSVALDPSLALALFVAPVLLNAGYDTSLRDLRDNWRPVAALSVVVVGLTAAAVAVVARAMVPDMPWAVAAALGATVAPPDASAAVTVLRRLAPPHRLQVVLEGESLLNDATALLIWRLALLAAASGGGLSWGQVVPAFLLTSAGGVIAGYGLARLYMLLTARVEETAIAVLLQFLATFAVWLLASRIGLSAIVTMVVYALTIAHSAPARMPARTRLTSNAVWEVVVLGLSILAFIMMGLQMQGILPRLRGHVGQFAGFALAVCATVIAVRMAWVMAYNVAVRWKNRHFGASLRRPMMLPTWRTGLVVGWSGMRGIVTLAIALALPAHTAHGAFPYRDLLVFAAFCVVLATLVVQGLTLPLLLRALHLTGDDTVAERGPPGARRDGARGAGGAGRRRPFRGDPAPHLSRPAAPRRRGRRLRRAAAPGAGPPARGRRRAGGAAAAARQRTHRRRGVP